MHSLTLLQAHLNQVLDDRFQTMESAIVSEPVEEVGAASIWTDNQMEWSENY